MRTRKRVVVIRLPVNVTTFVFCVTFLTDQMVTGRRGRPIRPNIGVTKTCVK